MASALTGLGFGLVLLAARGKQWIARFYAVRIVLAASAYLFWSVVTLAFFMGLPVGNLLLGSLAGLYLGRRAYHQGVATLQFQRQARWGGLFTAAVVAFISVGMGLLAIQEHKTLQVILGLIGLGRLAAVAAGRAVVVAIAVPALIAIQYWLTRLMAAWGFHLDGAGACRSQNQ